MGWSKSLPTTATIVSDSPAIFQANWVALEDWTNTEHYSLANAASGKHLPGKCGVVYVGTTVQIAALSSPPACAIAFDTTLGAFKYYSTTLTAWSVCQLDWDNIWTDAVHTHASSGEGGQLDWDNVWSDAVHDHTSDAEGGILTSTGSTLTFLATPVNKINWTGTANWTDVDISANTGTDTAKAALLAVELYLSSAQFSPATMTGLFRKNGSSETAVLPRIKANSGAHYGETQPSACMLIVECDASEIFETKLQTDSGSPAGVGFKVDLIGYFK